MGTSARNFTLSALVLVIALLAPCLVQAQNSPASLLPGQTGPRVITWDGSNGIAVNDAVGASTFYNQGVWGQGTVTANVEAGLIWNGHEATSTLKDFYTAPNAAGQTDMHATWVGSVLAGYDLTADPNNYPYYKLGMAPLTQLSSGAIASDWYNAVDPATGGTNTYFDTTPKAFYSAYNYYFTKTWTHTLDYGWFSVQFNAPTDVINSSWGYGDPTAIDPLTKAADGFARAHPLTAFVVAAGNANTAQNSSNNVGGPASGYNSIAVGATGDGTYNGFSSVADFSSRGPQDYHDPVHGTIVGVRAPVDLVAPGTTIVGAFYGGQTGGNGLTLATTQADPSLGGTDWYSFGLAGTSFAAPVVAGGISLLKSASYYVNFGDSARDTRVIKAVLMNSATKLPGWDNGQVTQANGTVLTTQSLDWTQGAGTLNLTRAFNEYLGGTCDISGSGGGEITTPVGWDFGSLGLSADQGVIAHNDYPIHLTLQASGTLDVTLDWFRDLGTPVLTDNIDPALQDITTADLGFANLDLEIWNADFTKFYAASQSLYNNVEELHFALPETGQYGIRINYASQIFGTPTPESYGLAWDVTDIPEPTAAGLLLAGMALLAGSRFRCQKEGEGFADGRRFRASDF